MQQVKVNVEELRRGGVVALKEDKFSLWVKTSCCNLNSRQIRKLADITDKYGRGLLLFTSRQIPIIPFVDLKDVPAVKQELAEVEMELDRCGSRVRNLNVCYEDKICPRAVVNCISLGERLEKFFGSPIMHKVKIGIAGCGWNCISVRTLSDIGFIGVEINGIKGYDAYVGGRLGLNPFVGIKVAQHLSEERCVTLVQNYFDLLERQGQKGERAADVIKRLGAETFQGELTHNLSPHEDDQVIPCPIKLEKKPENTVILKIRAASGELNSNQVRKIANIAEDFGAGFVHFTVRGAPEIPGVKATNLVNICRSLAEAGLQTIENDVENFQSCFGNYCLEGLADPQNLLRKIESRIAESGNGNLKITISGSGCPNSCGIAHLSDIGFHGVSEPELDVNNCTGCGLCVTVCKRKAIEIEHKKAVLRLEKCGHCGQCISICPLDALKERRKGFAVLIGGQDGQETRLGNRIAEFVSEEKALTITDNLLKLVQNQGGDAGKVINELGIQKIQEAVLPQE